MDKYEYNLKLEEITKLADQGYYEDAADIIDTIDWRRVRNVRTLCMISEIYEEVGRLQDSKALLLRAYRKSQAVRSILFHLTEISVKLREFDDAAEFYSEFVEAAPHDNSRYLLKYMIYRGRGAAIEDQIEILEEYNQKEYTEKYAYELAKLYYRAGQKEKCVDACDDLVVWFRQGKYVIRALELKQRIKALTPVQQAIYDNRNEATMPKAEMVENVAPDLEKAILENMPESSKEVITDDVISVTEKEIAQSVAEHTAEKEENDDYKRIYEQTLKNLKDIHEDKYVGKWILAGEVKRKYSTIFKDEELLQADEEAIELIINKDGTTNIDNIIWKESYLIKDNTNYIKMIVNNDCLDILVSDNSLYKSIPHEYRYKKYNK